MNAIALMGIASVILSLYYLPCIIIFSLARAEKTNAKTQIMPTGILYTVFALTNPSDFSALTSPSTLLTLLTYSILFGVCAPIVRWFSTKRVRVRVKILVTSNATPEGKNKEIIRTKTRITQGTLIRPLPYLLASFLLFTSVALFVGVIPQLIFASVTPPSGQNNIDPVVLEMLGYTKWMFGMLAILLCPTVMSTKLTEVWSELKETERVYGAEVVDEKMQKKERDYDDLADRA